MFLVLLVWALWIVVRGWVWDSNMPEVLVADEMGFCNRCASVAAAMISILLTGKFVVGLVLSILWVNTLDKWVNIV